jgi:hypothetical protein
MGNLSIFSSLLYDDLSLIHVFAQLQSLYLVSKYIGFPLEYALQLVEWFPSLVHLELEIYSVDTFVSLLNVLLDGLPKLIHLKIHFHKNKLLCDGTCLTNHITERRRQAFPHHIIKDDEIYVKIDGKILNIYLNGCSICEKTNFTL